MISSEIGKEVIKKELPLVPKLPRRIQNA